MTLCLLPATFQLRKMRHNSCHFQRLASMLMHLVALRVDIAHDGQTISSHRDPWQNGKDTDPSWGRA